MKRLINRHGTAFNRVTEEDFTHLHLAIHLHRFGTGSPPLCRGGALDSQPRPHTPAVEADWLTVPSARSRGHPLVSIRLSPAPLALYW